MYKEKYLKYKTKYLSLKKQYGGINSIFLMTNLLKKIDNLLNQSIYRDLYTTIIKRGEKINDNRYIIIQETITNYTLLINENEIYYDENNKLYANAFLNSDDIDIYEIRYINGEIIVLIDNIPINIRQYNFYNEINLICEIFKKALDSIDYDIQKINKNI